MYFDFLNILGLVTIFAGVICLVDMIMRTRQRRQTCESATSTVAKVKHPVIVEYARSFFPILFIVLFIRAFLFQPYRVPTGSLEPTIMPGDMILVSQYAYGLRLPIWNSEIFHVGEPKKGQIALFHWPVNPGVAFVKRVIGVPGDRISYINKVLYVNGKKQTQTLVGNATEIGPDRQTWRIKKYREDLNGVQHFIFIRPDHPAHDFKNVIVPSGKYFMMGDNRDDSDDSRSWGFVPASDYIGEALIIWMSWDANHHRVRWHRIGKTL